VVTNLKQSPQWIYEKTYCQRGDVENRIKETARRHADRPDQLLELFGEHLPVLLTAAAYVLMQEMRLHLSPTGHARRKSRPCASIF